MLIKSLRIRNLLSFGPDTAALELTPLNVLIGPNGSGKSNFIEVLALLSAVPTNLSAPVKDLGGAEDWIWKGKVNDTASLSSVIRGPFNRGSLRHFLSFGIADNRFDVFEEKIESERNGSPAHLLYNSEVFANPVIYEPIQRTFSGDPSDPLLKLQPRELPRMSSKQSILNQLKDPGRYPALSFLQDCYASIAIYRDWTFGRFTAPRQPQKADLPTDMLLPTAENLALVLNNIRPAAKARLLEALGNLYPGIDDFNVRIDAGRVQLFLEEGNRTIPATRLSDGTLRYISLLAVLCHPRPPALVCIEEPELGLHPDVLPEIARLLIEASTRTQLIVTTHSDTLVDALNEHPETVIVCEKHDGATQMRRLNSDDLTSWLEKYSLGRLWRMGEIGGNRW